MTTTTDTTTTAEQDGTRSRLPDPTGLYPELTALSAAVQKALRNGPVPQATLALTRLRTAQVIGSTYHGVAATDALRKAGEEERRITAVATWQSALLHRSRAGRAGTRGGRPHPEPVRGPGE